MFKLFALFFLVIVSCSGHEHDHQAHHDHNNTQLTNNELAHAVNTFAYDLLKQLEHQNKNVVFSPLSVSIALAMLLRGARNETEEQLYNVLKLNQYENKETIHQRMVDILNTYKDSSERNTTVELANLAMFAENLAILESYKKDMKDFYEAVVSNEDFLGNVSAITSKVNDFVKEKTHGIIEKLFKEPLDTDTNFLLLNTIYFNGFWEMPFSKSATHNMTFHNFDNTESVVEMMAQTKVHRFYEDNERNISLIELNYKGNYSMILVVPKEKNGLSKVMTLTTDDLHDMFEHMHNTYIRVHIPKIEIDYTIDLKEVLPKMGVNLPFNRNANLKGIADKVYVTKAKQQAKIKVTEEGTEAAAVTYIVSVTRIGIIDVKELIVDRPFAFVIRDRQQGLNLFAGVVNKL